VCRCHLKLLVTELLNYYYYYCCYYYCRCCCCCSSCFRYCCRYFASEVLRWACMYVCMSVCLSVCPLAYLKSNAHHFESVCTCYLRPWSAIRYVLPVMQMTSCFHIMEPVGWNQRRRYVSSSSLDGDTGGEVAVYDCRLVVITIFFNFDVITFLDVMTF